MTQAAEEPEVRLRKLEKINRALMNRVERSMDFSGNGFSLFQTAILLEGQVSARTGDLKRTLEDLSDAYARLEDARDDAEIAKQNLTSAIEAVSEGFALFNDAEELVMCNAPFRSLLPDIAARLEPGTSFRRIAESFSRSRFLVLDQQKSAEAWCVGRIELFRKPHASFIQQLSGDRWIQVSNKKTGAGATVVFQTDITDIVRGERLRRERELDEQSRLLQATLDHLPQGICMFSRDLRLKAWNHRFVDLLSLPLRLVAPLAGFDRLWDWVSKSVFAFDRAGALRVQEWSRNPSADLDPVELVKSDGTILRVSGNVMPDGGIVVSFADVTDERRASDALREAKETLEQRVEERTAALTREVMERRAIEVELIQARDTAEELTKSKTRFLAAASHDVLQPLNAARIFLSLLSGTGLDARQVHFAGKVDMAFGSVEEVLSTLLDISRYDSGSVEANVVPLSVAEILATLAAEFQPLADQKQLKLRCVPSELFGLSDARLLRQIIQNLVANAVRYTAKGGVLLGARRRGMMISIEVWDTGPGIPEDKRDFIFEEFRRLGQDLPDTPKGAGLGLAIVRRIARLLDHRITVASHVGKGSRFAIELPACAAPTRVIAPQVVTERLPVDLAHFTAIVIENDLAILEGMLELLQEGGMRAIPAVSAGEALETLQSLDKTPDLIIADYHLDQGTGAEAIEALRRAVGHQVPAIVVTADHSAKVQAEIGGSGIAYLRKPIKTGDLFALIHNVIAL
ncbi:response regulator [Nordella sp. HKS 07]|uniref:hybrid sensor histidine kinase/response regulator n=1 Tax=Nordella sp. HKS 07 TaxID=2712222 RepID=UPI0013E12E66|nr:PAS-domain containing protein [Nordella sp. HKS 07]QIG49032.1 response regulator [Nordella sp. HKS 07]